MVLAPWAWPQVRGWLRGAELIPLLPRDTRRHTCRHQGVLFQQTRLKWVPVAMEAHGLCHIVF